MSPILLIGENMTVEYQDYGFYKIDKDYLKYLNLIDNQVFFKNEEEYERKPHLGLITNINGFTYCIPLTSAKKRHLGWQNVTEHNYLIYEMVTRDEIHKTDIFKKANKEGSLFKKLLSVLEIRKMIPVNDSVITKIIFDEIDDINYKNLLTKEYLFLSKYKPEILIKAKELYVKQKESNVVKPCYVTFDNVEKFYSQTFQKDTQ